MKISRRWKMVPCPVCGRKCRPDGMACKPRFDRHGNPVGGKVIPVYYCFKCNRKFNR